MADVTRLHSTRHDVQENTSETNDLRFSKRKREQIDYILTKRRYLRHTEDAEDNDMMHMGSDHRCVMATFTITMLGKNIHYKNTRRKHDMIEYEERDQAKKMKSGSLRSTKDTRRSLNNQRKGSHNKKCRSESRK